MDFRFNPDEEVILAEAGRVFNRYFPISRFSQLMPEDPAWRQLGESGWLHAGLTEDLGGAGLPLYMMAGVAREAGRQLVVEEFVNNGYLLPMLIASGVDTDQRDAWLHAHLEHPGYIWADGRRNSLCSGAESGVMEWVFGVDPGATPYRLIRIENGYRLGKMAGILVGFHPMAGLSFGVGTVHLKDGSTAPEWLDLEISAASLDEVVRKAMILHGAGLVGLGESAVAQTVQYLKIRRQFGQPVGQFQAPKHILADVYTKLAVAWAACLHAAVRPEISTAAVAHLQSSQASLLAAKAMVQLHGGIGFTWDHPSHVYLKTALNGGQRFGGAERHALALGQALVASLDTGTMGLCVEEA